MTTEDPSHPEPPPGWLHMRTAPETGRYWVINRITGPYITEPRDGEWPLYDWGGIEGVWYPTPYGWRRLESDDDA